MDCDKCEAKESGKMCGFCCLVGVITRDNNLSWKIKKEDHNEESEKGEKIEEI